MTRTCAPLSRVTETEGPSDARDGGKHAADVLHRAADVDLSRRRGPQIRRHSAMFSNKFFDPVAGARLYNEYMEQ